MLARQSCPTQGPPRQQRQPVETAKCQARCPLYPGGVMVVGAAGAVHSPALVPASSCRRVAGRRECAAQHSTSHDPTLVGAAERSAAHENALGSICDWESCRLAACVEMERIGTVFTAVDTILT
jgi:hypothetical protein